MTQPATTDQAAEVESGDGSPLLPPTRRAVLAGAGAAALVVLTGCATYDSNQTASGGDGGDATTKVIAKTTDVPIGGGFVTDHGIVVTQPTAGKYLGFTSVCTHQGCTVGGVDKGLIACPCHGSTFKMEDGSVKDGPANRPLRKIDITVNGTEISRV